MLKSNTVLIVGAGASCEAKLPSGLALKESIANSLHFEVDDFGRPQNTGDRDLYNVFRQLPDATQYLEACRKIYEGLPLSKSIDDYITQQEDEAITRCAKLAIARNILVAEKNSNLYYAPTNIYEKLDLRGLSKCWYYHFYQLLCDQVPQSRKEQLFNNVTLIVFNYDRCIEQYLVHAISQNYHLSIPDSKKIVATLKILRPYGSVGPYFGDDQVPFGHKGTPDFSKVQATLRTYGETEDSAKGEEIKKAIADASTLVFLGNHYHLMNMDLVTPIGGSKQPKQIYYTITGRSESDLMVIRKMLEKLWGSNARCNDGYFHKSEVCSSLFTDYALMLRTDGVPV